MYSGVKGIEESRWLLKLIGHSKIRELCKPNYFYTYFKENP